MTADRAGAGGPDPDGFGGFVRRVHDTGHAVVQPRMGFGDPAAMRAGLLATRRARAHTAGTVTLDSYTRVGDPGSARRALDSGAGLNGYPIRTHPTHVTASMVDSVRSPAFAVQVRHGSAAPQAIITASLDAGLDATEGGPVSYCLPYGRTPLAESVRNWEESCRLLAAADTAGSRPHLESFGGCMLGQLCPPGLLVAITVLEGLFFRQHGLRSISVSYAQQPDPGQNRDAVRALRLLCGELLSDLDWHVVIYAYMGVYPTTPGGCLRVLDEAARLTGATGCERLVVKTVAESLRIPTIEENVAALERAGAVLDSAAPDTSPDADTEVGDEARALVEAVLGLDDDLGTALRRAFELGVLDVPYCLHPDNAGRARSVLDGRGRIRWADTGSMPLPAVAGSTRAREVSSADLIESLTYMQRTNDSAAAPAPVGAATADRQSGAAP